MVLHIKKVSHRHAQKPISQITLDPVKLGLTNHHSLFSKTKNNEYANYSVNMLTAWWLC